MDRVVKRGVEAATYTKYWRDVEEVVFFYDTSGYNNEINYWKLLNTFFVTQNGQYDSCQSSIYGNLDMFKSRLKATKNPQQDCFNDTVYSTDGTEEVETFPEEVEDTGGVFEEIRDPNMF